MKDSIINSKNSHSNIISSGQPRKSFLFAFLGLFVVVLLFSNSVSAFEFDNVKRNYRSVEKTIDIVNSFGSGSTIANVKLISNTDQALINGEAIFEIKLLNDYTEGVIDGTRFVNRRNKQKSIIGNWDIWNKRTWSEEVKDYTEVCDSPNRNGTINCWQNETGSHFERRSEWRWSAYNGEDVLAGTHKFRLTAKKNKGESVDFLPILMGVELDEFAWWNDNWIYKKKINISNTNVDSDLTNFTHLIKLNSTNFDFAKAQTNGEDIRFLNLAEDSELSYEIEYWSSVNEEAVIWVRIPTLTSATNTQIYMYYDNALATDGQNIFNTWDSSFDAVYHMSETTNTKFYDSTSNANNMTGGAGTSTTGYIYNAFNQPIGTMGTIEISGSDNFTLTTVSRFLSTAIDKSPVTGNDHLQFPESRTTSLVGYFLRTTDSAHIITTATSLDTNWHVWDLTYDGANIRSYMDGVLINTEPATGVVGTMTSIGFGQWLATNSIVDETRFLNYKKSDAFIKADYYSMANEMNTFGGEEQDGIGTGTKLTPVNLSVNSGWNINFSANFFIFSSDNITNATFNIFDPLEVLINQTVFLYPLEDSQNETPSFLYNISGDYFGNETFKWSIDVCVTNGQCSEAGLNSNFTGFDDNFTFFVDNIAPTINVYEPTLFGSLIGVPLKYTYEDLNDDICWYNIDGGTNTTNTCSSNDTTITVGSYGSQTINIFINDTVSNNASDSKQFNIIERASEVYVSSAIEGNDATFDVVLDDLNNAISSVTFTYNNTDYSTIITDTTGTLKTFETTISVPQIDTDTFLATFNWTVFATVESVLENYTYSSNTQTITNIFIVPTTDGSTCEGSLATNYAINWTFKDELTDLVIDNVEMTTFFEAWSSNPLTTSVFTWDENHTGLSSYPTCVYPNGFNINSDIKILYGDGVNYSVREWNIQSSVLNSTTLNNYTLYLLNSTEATTIVVTLIDNFGSKLIDYEIEVWKKNYGNAVHTNIQVESGVTNNQGEIVVELESPVSTDYYFKVFKDGATACSPADSFHTAGPITVSSLELTCTQDLTTLSGIYQDWGDITVSDITYSNTTGNVTMSYNDETSNVASEMCLSLYNFTQSTAMNNDNFYAEDCSSNSSAVLVVNIGNYTGLHMGAQSYITMSSDGNKYPFSKSLEIINGGGYSNLGLGGIWWFGVVVIGTTTGMLLFSPAAAIGGSLLILFVLSRVTDALGVGWYAIAWLIAIGAFLMIRVRQ